MRMASVDTIVTLAQDGQHGRTWYEDVTNALDAWARENGFPVKHVLAAFACGSIRTQVHVHMQVAWSLLTGEPTGGRTPLPVHTAMWERFLATGTVQAAEPRKNRKVANFFRALCGDETAIPLDVWMARALGIPEHMVTRVPVADKAESRIKQAAKRLGWTAAEVQAAVWTAAYEREMGKPAPRLVA